MKCHNCGNEVPEKSVFCGICGARLTPENEETAEPIVDVPNSAEEEFSKNNDVSEITEESVRPESTVEPEGEAAKSESTMEPEGEAANTENAPSVSETEYTGESASAEPVENADGAEDEPGENVNRTDAYSARPGEEFVIRHCPRCGAALMNGAKFCSNCGNPIVVNEQNVNNKKTGGKWIKPAVIGIIAALAIIFGASYFAGCHSIEGEWEVENSENGFFDMLSKSYLEFDDGTAVYYNGLFNASRYMYSYNRLTKTLTLYGAARDGADATMRVEWHNGNSCVIRELGMTLRRVDDLPYSDDEFDDSDIVQY